MNAKTLIGTTMAAALLGFGMLAGTVVGTGSASAQTGTATPTSTATTAQPGTSKDGSVNGMPGGRGGRYGGHGRGGFAGGFGGNATADGATQAITNATTSIANAKSDLVYATGKMDTADVQRWITGAEALLKSAQSAQSGSQYGQAVAYARAASELARVANEQMAQKLGASTLPSYSQMPQRSDKDNSGANSTAATPTQAQASRILAQTYNRLVAEGSQVKSASNASEATPYLTDAQKAYQAAYTAYGAGNYSDAVASARLAERLAGVAGSVAQASTAANSDTPVTVPAPTF